LRNGSYRCKSGRLTLLQIALSCGEVRSPPHSQPTPYPLSPVFEIRLQEAFRQRLHPRFGMHGDPALEQRVVFEAAVLAGQVVEFRNPAQRDLTVTVAHDGETHRVGDSFFRQTRAVASVSEIAGVFQFFVGGDGAIVTGSTAASAITSAQRKSGGMHESAIIKTLRRNEVGAGQETKRYHEEQITLRTAENFLLILRVESRRSSHGQEVRS